MVDVLVLLMTLGMLAIVVFFAMRLDRKLPWFERPRPPGKPAPTAGRAPTARTGARPPRFPVR